MAENFSSFQVNVGSAPNAGDGQSVYSSFSAYNLFLAGLPGVFEKYALKDEAGGGGATTIIALTDTPATAGANNEIFQWQNGKVVYTQLTDPAIPRNPYNFQRTYDQDVSSYADSVAFPVNPIWNSRIWIAGAPAGQSNLPRVAGSTNKVRIPITPDGATAPTDIHPVLYFNTDGTGSIVMTSNIDNAPIFTDYEGVFIHWPDSQPIAQGGYRIESRRGYATRVLRTDQETIHMDDIVKSKSPLSAAAGTPKPGAPSPMPFRHEIEIGFYTDAAQTMPLDLDNLPAGTVIYITSRRIGIHYEQLDYSGKGDKGDKGDSPVITMDYTVATRTIQFMADGQPLGDPIQIPDGATGMTATIDPSIVLSDDESYAVPAATAAFTREYDDAPQTTNYANIATTPANAAVNGHAARFELDVNMGISQSGQIQPTFRVRVWQAPAGDNDAPLVDTTYVNGYNTTTLAFNGRIGNNLLVRIDAGGPIGFDGNISAFNTSRATMQPRITGLRSSFKGILHDPIEAMIRARTDPQDEALAAAARAREALAAKDRDFMVQLEAIRGQLDPLNALLLDVILNSLRAATLENNTEVNFDATELNLRYGGGDPLEGILPRPAASGQLTRRRHSLAGRADAIGYITDWPNLLANAEVFEIGTRPVMRKRADGGLDIWQNIPAHTIPGEDTLIFREREEALGDGGNPPQAKAISFDYTGTEISNTRTYYLDHYVRINNAAPVIRDTLTPANNSEANALTFTITSPEIGPESLEIVKVWWINANTFRVRGARQAHTSDATANAVNRGAWYLTLTQHTPDTTEAATAGWLEVPDFAPATTLTFGLIDVGAGKIQIILNDRVVDTGVDKFDDPLLVLQGADDYITTARHTAPSPVIIAALESHTDEDDFGLYARRVTHSAILKLITQFTAKNATGADIALTHNIWVGTEAELAGIIDRDANTLYFTTGG